MPIKKNKGLKVKSVTYVHDPEAINIWLEFWLEKVVEEAFTHKKITL